MEKSNAIVQELYFTPTNVQLDGVCLGKMESGVLDALGRITFCVLITQDGEPVVGESICADPLHCDPAEERASAKRRALMNAFFYHGVPLTFQAKQCQLSLGPSDHP
ncbi:hypothetical protein [Chromobacterium amazonense]|nr:hypothetical protein [Chromobacterium amazonense]